MLCSSSPVRARYRLRADGSLTDSSEFEEVTSLGLAVALFLMS